MILACSQVVALGASATVDVGNDRRLAPTTVSIGVGDSVTWAWVGPDYNHVVVSDPDRPRLGTPTLA